jgi:hypothetical protein
MVILIVRFKARLTSSNTLAYSDEVKLLERTYGALRGCYRLVSNLNIIELIKKLTIVINKKICYNLYKYYKL